MKREIKFRAWTGEEMIDGVQPNFTEENMCMIPDDNGAFIHEPNASKGFWYNVKVNEVMQYTGLKDKNGVEIYEGDIVKGGFYNGSFALGKVVFEHGQFLLYPIPNIEGYCEIHKHYDVIGNIYENPELLK